MNLLHRTAVICVLGMLCLPGAGNATERADFFDISHKPSISFSNLTWTLRNQVLERVVRFDGKTGSLRTVSFRDMAHNRELKSAPKSEGAFSFAAPLLEPPKPITLWKVSETEPASIWTSPGFNDAAWKDAVTPLSAAQPGKALWLRGYIAGDRMQNNHAYALIVQSALAGDAEIYVDGTLAQKVVESEQPQSRTYQIDLIPTNRVIAIKVVGRAAPGGVIAPISVGEVGSAPPSLDLDSDWKYMVHSINTNEDNSEVLTISLSGINKHEGLDVDVHYQIYPGNEPFMAKWFTFNSHRTPRYLIEQTTYDQWLLPGTSPNVQKFVGSCLSAIDPATNNGLVSAVLSPQGRSELASDGKSVAVTMRPYTLVKTDTAIQTPKAIVGLYRGPTATGAFLYQLYLGEYVARATSTSLPARFNTKFGYGKALSAKLCEQIIPTAAALGVKLFVLDDGWQTNTNADAGTIGDWNVDRTKFPQGLAPISAMVRERNMRFGLWAMPCAVNDRSQAAIQHSEWLMRQADGTRFKEGADNSDMCFTSGWEDNFSESMQQLCHELTVTYLKLDGNLLIDGCVVPAHDHPVAHAMSEQVNHWTNCAETLQKVDATFALDRGAQGVPELLNVQDTLGPGVSNVAGSATPGYPVADSIRTAASGFAWTCPGFALSVPALCATGDLNRLEYHLTSGCALSGSVELQGKLDALNAKEQETIARWVKWSEDNRPWLAYTQPLSASTGAAPGNAVLHLRNELRGKYGYLCLWNPSAKPDRATISFAPADYFVKLNTDGVQLVRLKDGKPQKFASKNGLISLTDFAMEPLSWEIFEIRKK